MKDFKLKIEYVPIDTLTPYEKNARRHQELDVNFIKNSIKQFGMSDPIGVWSDKNIIVEGHGRWMALKELGYTEVPIIRLDHLTDEERKAYALAHNKTAERSEWDMDLLLDELAELNGTFDMESVGFDDILIDEEEKEVVDDDFVPTFPEKPKAQYGDIYQLGEHRLMCGDSTKEEDVNILMNGAKVDFMLTDPPYNVDYSANGTREGIENDHFKSDEEAGEKLWLPAFTNARKFANECCSYICFMPQGGTHMMMMMMMMMRAGWQVKHELIWKKQSIVLNRADFNYQHEPMLYGWNEKHIFYGKGDFAKTSVWEFDRPTKSKEHPTMKPIPLLCEALKNLSKKNDTVMDLFGGSGSTLIACEQLNRKCYMMELDPKYVDVIIQRWETFTGRKATKLNA